MPRRCTVCDHSKRPAIDRALVARTAPVLALARSYGLASRSIYRHACEHLPETLTRAAGAKEDARATDLMQELEACMARVKLLFDACDRWLRDADNPDQYDIGPRAEELSVTYWAPNGDGQVATRRKAKLSALLALLSGVAPGVTMVEMKHADPRELALKTSAQLQHHLELLGLLIGKLEGRTTVNVLVMPQWREVQQALVRALGPYPDARARVIDVLSAIGSVIPASDEGRRDVH